MSYSPAPPIGGSPLTSSTSSRKASSTGNYRTSMLHAETKLALSRSSALSHVAGSPSSNSALHHRGGSLRRFTPSPPAGHRSGSGSVVGGGASTVRNAPYYSPRGSARNSPPLESSRSHVTGSLRGVSRSPTQDSPRTSPTGFPLAPPPQDVSHAHSSSSSAASSPNRSPRNPLLANLNDNSNHIPLERTLSPYQTSPTSNHAPPVLPPSFSRPSSLEAPPAKTTPPPSPNHLNNPPSPPMSGSQSPPHTLNFEDGRVLSQLPYEYSSFLDLPPSTLGRCSYCWRALVY